MNLCIAVAGLHAVGDHEGAEALEATWLAERRAEFLAAIEKPPILDESGNPLLLTPAGWDAYHANKETEDEQGTD